MYPKCMPEDGSHKGRVGSEVASEHVETVSEGSVDQCEGGKGYLISLLGTSGFAVRELSPS